MDDPPTDETHERITDADVQTMLASDGQLLLAQVLLQLLAAQPTVFDNAGGGPLDKGRALRMSAEDRLVLFLLSKETKHRGAPRRG